jgi:phenylacetate-CoA ligase
LYGVDNSTLPTMVHTYPEMRFPEAIDGYILFTVNNSIPLVRYQILDRGHVITPTEMSKYLASQGRSIPEELSHLNDRPYICLFNRTDVATTFYALNIYPENIKHGLELPQFAPLITGKFVIKTDYTANQEQLLTLQIELKQGVASNSELSHAIQDSVTLSLRKLNGEYNRLYQEIKDRAVPTIELIDYGSPQFQVNVKHRWIAPTLTT